MNGFDWERDYALEELLQSVIAVKEFPNKIARVINGLKPEDFDKTYRDGSWNVRQIIHHLADSHMNGYIRSQHIIHHSADQIQLFHQDDWSTGLGKDFHHEASFMILLGLHQRWSLLWLECLKQPDVYLAKSIYHPELERHVSLAQFMVFYAWHGEHHLEQILRAIA